MSRILVTGAAGFIGSHTVDLLLAQGHAVAGVDNFRTGREQNLSGAVSQPDFRLHRADVAEPGVLLGLTRDFRPEAIIHLAALVSVPESITNPTLNRRLNYDATTLVAEAAHAAGTKRIVFASSAAVYGNNEQLPLAEAAGCQPLSPYGQAKLDSEQLLLTLAPNSAITARCQRYFNVYGPRQDPSSPYSGVISRFVEAAMNGREPMVHGDGLQTRDFIYVGDVARANVLAATRPGIPSGVANICTGDATSLQEVLKTLAAILDRPLAPTYGPSRAADIRHSLGLPATARAELGFVPEIPLRRGLQSLLSSLA